MKKITELTQESFRTIHYRDEYGNLVRDTEDIIVRRKVKGLSGGLRFTHLIVDGICFQIALQAIDFGMSNLVELVHFNLMWSTFLTVQVLILLIFSYPLFYTFCEYNWQKTPAKLLTKSVVIDEYGNKPDLRTLALRNVIRLLPFEVFSFDFGDASSDWHDRWSKTWVVSEDELAELKKIQEEQSKEEQLIPG